MHLLPNPRTCIIQPGQFEFKPGLLIRTDPGLLATALNLQQALHAYTRITCDLAAGWAVPDSQIGVDLLLAPAEIQKPQGYRLSITPQRITLKGCDPAGLFYGVNTLIQILQTEASPEQPQIPCLEILDWPDFPVRGVMLDISRDKVPTMETLYTLVELLASWKVNHLQLYTEHTFAYRSHPEVWQFASPLTGDEILKLDAYCRERFIELVPNQNSFGHLQRWLKHPRYSPLAETMNEFPVPWGTEQGPFSLAPAHPGSLDLLRSMYDELLPHFSSSLFNVGLDETFDLGQGQSEAECQQRGTGPVYLDFLLKIYAEVSRRGKTMLFWGDIVNLQPELAPLLPRDTIALPWGYDANHPFDIEAARFEASGIPYYVCPGTSSWDSLGGRTANALANLLNAAENGLKHNACGYLNTDWGDFGHWHVLPVSYIGFAAGAAYSWCLAANRDADLPPLVSTFAFHDPTGSMGRLAADLGNIYRVPRIQIDNSSALFWVLQWPLAQIASYPEKLALISAAQAAGQPVQGIRVEGTDFSTGALQAQFEECIQAIDQAMQALAGARMTGPLAGLHEREMVNTARLMRLACRRAQSAFTGANEGDKRSDRQTAAQWDEFLAEYRSVWLARNRPGGLTDSTARFESIRAELAL